MNDKISSSFISRAFIVTLLLITSYGASAREWQSFGPAGGPLLDVRSVGSTVWVADWNFLHVRRGDAPWETISVAIEGRSLAALEALSVDPRDPDTIAVGGTLQPSRRVTAISTDGGATWFIPEDLAGLEPEKFRPAGFDTRGRLYAIVDPVYGCGSFKGVDSASGPPQIAGLYRSDSEMETWVHLREACIEDVTIDPVDPDVIYLGRVSHYGGNLVSRDGGDTWQPWDTLHPRELIADRHLPGVRHATASDGLVELVMFSTDDGHNWSLLGNGLPLSPDWRHRSKIRQQSDGTIVAVSPRGVFAFDGIEWQPVETPFRHGLGIAEDGHRIVVASEEGLFERTTEAGWAAVDVGHVSTEVQSIATDPTDASVVYASISSKFSLQEGRLFRSTDRGRSWEELELPNILVDFRGLRLTVDGAGTVYALRTADFHAVYRLRRGASSWEQLTMPGTRFIEARTTGQTVYSLHHERMVLSTDGAQSWIVLDLPDSLPNGSQFREMTVTGSDDEVILGGAREGIFRSTDRGKSWEAVLDSDIRKIAASPAQPSVIYAFASRILYRSEDYGATWAQISSLPSGHFVSAVAVDPLDAMKIYVATGGESDTIEGGWAFRSRNGGLSWERIDEGLEPLDRPVESLAVSADGSSLFAATRNGVRQIDLGPDRRRAVSRRR
jgi:photosystem II stability/assembly factor-like uncharacterized protein